MRAEAKVVHCEHVSDRGFEALVAGFDEAVGGRLEADYAADLAAATSAEDFERRMRAAEGPSGFMRFSKLDHGAWMGGVGLSARSIVYTIGNPLIARTMLKHGLGASLYVPVRVLVYEDSEGKGRIAYDLPSTLMGHLGNAEVTAAAQKLDTKMEELARSVSGAAA